MGGKVGCHAESDFVKFGVGTILTLNFSPHVVGHAPPQLAVGNEISVSFATNARTKMKIIRASADAITVELPDTSRWELTRRTASDSLFGGVPTWGVPSQDWFVRSPA
jgi:hypothetical protein